MLRFENLQALYLLLFLPPAVILFLWQYRRSQKKIRKVLGERLSFFLLSSVSEKKRYFKIFLECLVVLLVVLALARPQSGGSLQEIKSEGVELIFMVDVSTSMLAEDVRPNRLSFAKKELEKILNYLQGDKVGVIAFAGSAALLSPMTVDKSALLMYLDSLSTDSVSAQGTEFRRALQEAGASFERSQKKRDDSTQVTKVILIASDGEDNEAGAIEEAKILADKGIHIFSLAFGTEKGAAIPIRDGNGYLLDYKKNKEGNPILSQTKGTILKELARVGKGSFYHVTFGGNTAKKVAEEIKKLHKTEFATSSVVLYDERYQIFLFAAIFLALLELLLGERRKEGRFWKGRFEVKS